MKTTFLVIALFLSLGASAQEIEMFVTKSSEVKVDSKEFLLLNLSPSPKLNLKINPSCLKSENPIKPLTNDLLFAANVAAGGFATYSLLKSDYDKTKHFMAGYIISSTTSGALQLILPKEMKHRKLVAAAIGLGTSVLIGSAKEVYDAQHPLNHTADKYDAYATFAGGAAGTVTISFADVKRVFARKKMNSQPVF